MLVLSPLCQNFFTAYKRQAFSPVRDAGISGDFFLLDKCNCFAEIHFLSQSLSLQSYYIDNLCTKCM